MGVQQVQVLAVEELLPKKWSDCELEGFPNILIYPFT